MLNRYIIAQLIKTISSLLVVDKLTVYTITGPYLEALSCQSLSNLLTCHIWYIQ